MKHNFHDAIITSQATVRGRPTAFRAADDIAKEGWAAFATGTHNMFAGKAHTNTQALHGPKS